MKPVLVRDDTLGAHGEWEVEERTPVEAGTLKRLIAEAVRSEMSRRDGILALCAAVIVAVVVGFMAAMAFTLWGPQ